MPADMDRSHEALISAPYAGILLIGHEVPDKYGQGVSTLLRPHITSPDCRTALCRVDQVQSHFPAIMMYKALYRMVGRHPP